MNQRMILGAALAVVAVAGCKGKGKGKGKAADPPPAAGTGSAPIAATYVAPPTPDAAAAAAVPNGPAAKVLPGKETPRGCIGWSAKQHAAACVTGTMTNGEPDLQVVFVGGTGAAVPVAASLADDDAAKINAALAIDGYVVPSGAVTTLEPGKPLTLGTATLTLDRKTTKPGGNNVAPTAAIKLTAVCGGKDVVLYREELEGGTPTVTVRAIDDRLLIEVTIAIAREGEQGETFGAAVLAPATCVAATELD
jgi:hypothetical protein